jgi:hypothetical protein
VLVRLGELVAGLSKIFTPLCKCSKEIKDDGRSKISDLKRAPAFGWSLVKGKIFPSKTTSLDI